MRHLLIALLFCFLVAPASSWSAAFTEDFDCADSASLNCDLTWTELVGTDWQIISNNAVVSGNTGFDQAFPTSLMTTDTQYAGGVLHFAPNGTNNLGVVLECQRHATDNTRYSLSANANAATKYWGLDKIVAGVTTVLGTHAQDPAENDVVRIECIAEGATMRVTASVNAVELMSAVDSSSPITGNVRMGISAFSDGAGQTGGWKSVEYGDFTVTAVGGRGGINPAILGGF